MRLCSFDFLLAPRPFSSRLLLPVSAIKDWFWCCSGTTRNNSRRGKKASIRGISQSPKAHKGLEAPWNEMRLNFLSVRLLALFRCSWEGWRYENWGWSGINGFTTNRPTLPVTPPHYKLGLALVFVLHACTIWDRSLNCYVIFYAPSPDFFLRYFPNKKPFSEIAFNISFLFYYSSTHTPHRIRNCSCTFFCVMLPVEVMRMEKKNPAITAPRFTPPSLLKKSLFYLLGLGGCGVVWVWYGTWISIFQPPPMLSKRRSSPPLLAQMV